MEPKVIHFAGKGAAYGFLSNFYPAQFIYLGRLWFTSEHAYQASKTLIVTQQGMIQSAPTPGKAKRLGQTVTLRSDWPVVRDQVMLDICMQKFMQNDELRQWLLNTGDTILVEHRPDYYWGDGGDGTGQNKLGMVLMAVRSFFDANRGSDDESGAYQE